MQPLEPLAEEDAGGERLDEVSEDTQTEEAMEVPFGLIGASILCNILQYAVLLGLTMIILIIIRVFMPTLTALP